MGKKISIIIRTYNEIRHIQEVLSSIYRQNYTNFEVVVVDSGSNDGTNEIIAGFANKYGNFKIVHIEKSEFNYSYASNVGAKCSNGDILVYLSGHSKPVRKDYLQLVDRIMSEESVKGCYGDTIPYMCGGGVKEKMFYLAGYWKNIFSPKKYERSIRPGILSCSNAAISREIWLEHPFENELGKGGEDVEMAYYILRKGFKICFLRKMLVKHSHHKSNKDFNTELKKWSELYQNVVYFIEDKYGNQQ